MRVFYVVGPMVSLIPFLGIGLFILYFSGMPFFIPFVLVLYVSLGILLSLRVFHIERHKRTFYGLVVTAIVIALIPTIPGLYHKTRPVVQAADVDLSEYSPFGKITKAVELNEPATFQLKDNLPIIDGATALYPVYAAFAQAVYPKKEYDPYNSEVMSNRTGEAYRNLISGKVDMIFVAAPSENQLAAAKRAGRELHLTPIGKESFVFFVHAKNPIENLTTNDLQNIYSGKITNWQEVGGENQSIRAFQRDEGSGSQTALQHFMGDVPIMDPPVEDIATIMGTMVDVVADYKNYKNALGYTFRYYSTQMVNNNNIRLLSVDGVEPTIDSIRSDEYPLSDELYIVTAGSENPHIDDFIEWILSEQGQEIVEKTGYVSLIEKSLE